MAEVEIRRMQESDVDHVVRIEKDLFATPWSKMSFLFEVSDNRTSFPIVVVERGEIIGYAVGWFVEDELHIGNIAVRRDRQGSGIGKMLLERLLEEARARGTSYATLEVRVSNVRAINLYRKYGFRGVAIRKNYYSDNGEDALVMIVDIGKRVKQQNER